MSSFEQSDALTAVLRVGAALDDLGVTVHARSQVVG